MDIYEIIKKIPPADSATRIKAEERWLSIAKPLYSLGKLENIITKISAVKKTLDYSLSKKAVVIMCADNGVVEENVTQTSQEMTACVSANFLKGEASVCIMSKIANADIFPVDVGISSDIEHLSDKDIKISYGTKNIAREAAMSRSNAERAVMLGISYVHNLKEKGYNIIAGGEMGIGNTTTSSAVISALTSLSPEETTGRGAGLSTEALKHKISVVKKALSLNSPDKDDPIDVIAKVGGLDIAALTGLFLGGGYYCMPVVADGLISSAAALAAVRLNKNVLDYIIASHFSKESIQTKIFDELNLSPIIKADMCIGEGTGAVALFPLIDMAYGVFSKMPTFAEGNYCDTYKVLK